MVTKNEITGKEIRSKPSSELYRQNWELIFGNPLKTELEKQPPEGESKDDEKN